MAFAHGCARPLYDKGTHPRVLIGPAELAGLRTRTRSGGGKRLADAVRAKAGHAARLVNEADDLAATVAGWNREIGQAGTQIVGALEDMALVSALDRNAAMADAVRRVLLVAADTDAQSRHDSPVRRFAYGAGGLCLAYDLVHRAMDARDRRAFVSWISTFALPFILDVIPPAAFLTHAGGNMALGGFASAVSCALAIDGDPGARSQRSNLRLLVTYMEAALHAAIGPEGYPEEDIGYGTEVATSLAYSAESLRRAGLYDAYAECPRLAKFGRAILHFVQPWGRNLSNTGDFMDTFGRRVFILARLATETNDPALLWLLGTLANERDYFMREHTLEVPVRRGIRVPVESAGLLVLDDLRTPVHPARADVPTQFMDPMRGIVSFRSGWRAADTLLVFDGSQRSNAGQGHAHASAGNFTISAAREYFAIDCGRYCNEQQEHNVVLVNGRSGFSHERLWTATPYAGLLTGYAPHPLCDSASADTSRQTQCMWARRWIGLVKGGPSAYVWTVDDVNHENDWAEFWWTLNTEPENRIRLRARSATVLGQRCGGRLDVHFALPAPDSYLRPHTLALAQDVNTCRATDYIGDPLTNADNYAVRGVHGSVQVRPRLIGKVSGYNGRFMSVMVPTAAGATPPRVRQVPSLPNSLAVRVSFDDVEDTVIFAYEHNLLEAEGVKGYGQWCVVRRRRGSGRVLAHALGTGTKLLADGKVLAGS